MGKRIANYGKQILRGDFLNIKNLSARPQHLLAACIIIAALVLFYRDVVFYGRTFLMESTVSWTTPNGPYNYQGVQPGFVSVDPGAIAWQIEPFNKFISESIRRGDFPLWNPYSGLAGAPLYADGHTAPLEPIQLLFYFIPLRKFWPLSVDLQLLIRFFITGFCCYLFARRLRIDFLGSVAAGLLFMINAYFLAYGNHSQVKTEVLLPLILYGYDRVADIEDKRGLWLCALFIGWAIIAGMPEATFFVLFLGSLWYFYKLIFIKRGIEKNTFFRYITATGMGIMLAAVYFLPLFEFISLAKSAHHPGAIIGLFPLSGIPGLVFGWNWTYWTRIGFIGLFSLFFSFINIRAWPDRRNEILFFGGYACFFLLAMFDFLFTKWIARLPIFNQIVMIKYPFPSIYFCVAILTGIIIDRAGKSRLSNQKIWVALLLVCSVIVLPIIFVPAPAETKYFKDIADEYTLFKLITGLSLAVIGVNVFFENKNRLLQIGLIPIFLFEIVMGSMLFTRPSRVYPFQTPPFVSYLRKDTSSFRIFGLDNVLYPNISTAYRIQDIRWLDALVPQRAYDFSSRFIDAGEGSTMRYTGTAFPASLDMMNLLNVKYILSVTTLEGRVTPAHQLQYDEVYHKQSIYIYRNENALPHAFVMYNVINVNNFQSALDRMDTPSFDPGKIAVIENLPVELSALINQHEKFFPISAGTTRIVKSGQLDVKVNAEAPGLLIVSEQYYPGWVAYVDGESAPIYAVDGIFRGVFLEKGEHHVEFKYLPLSFIIGGGISLISLIFVLMMLIKQKQRIKPIAQANG